VAIGANEANAVMAATRVLMRMMYPFLLSIRYVYFQIEDGVAI
jgi:hypothetical protein